MAEPAITQDEQRLKQRAMRRLAMALTLIAVAIVALALLDRYNASLKKTEPVLGPPPEPPAPLAQPPGMTAAYRRDAFPAIPGATRVRGPYDPVKTAPPTWRDQEKTVESRQRCLFSASS